MKSKLPVSSLSLLCVIIAINGYSAPGGPLHNRQFQIINPAALSGGNFGDAWDVNNAGQVVGAANTNFDGQYSAFVFDVANGLRFLPSPPNGQWTLAAAINGFRGVLWERNRIYELNDLLPAGTGFRTLAWARGINDNGSIVGYGYTANALQPFILVPTHGKQK